MQNVRANSPSLLAAQHPILEKIHFFAVSALISNYFYLHLNRI